MKIKVTVPVETWQDGVSLSRVVEVEIDDEQMKALAQEVAAQFLPFRLVLASSIFAASPPAGNANRWADRSKMEYLITAKYPEGFPPVSDLIREHEVGERVQELARQGYHYISLVSAQHRVQPTNDGLGECLCNFGLTGYHAEWCPAKPVIIG